MIGVAKNTHYWYLWAVPNDFKHTKPVASSQAPPKRERPGDEANQASFFAMLKCFVALTTHAGEPISRSGEFHADNNNADSVDNRHA